MIEVFRSLRDAGSLVVCVHHDLSSVPEIFDHVLLLNRHVIASGPVKTAFTPANVARAYRLPVSG
jgi:manganese/zinc/iron transport system ATP- binding protein